MIAIDVLGAPGAKGSPHTRIHNGRVIVQETKAVKSWEHCVREAIAIDVFDGAMPRVPLFVDKPLRVGIVFRLARPIGHRNRKTGELVPSAPPMPHKRLDADKLARATLDPMIGSIYDDDSRIVELGVVKVYAQPGREGARITVDEWRPA